MNLNQKNIKPVQYCYIILYNYDVIDYDIICHVTQYCLQLCFSPVTIWQHYGDIYARSQLIFKLQTE